GVSLRVLQKAFQAEGRSISGSILDARLARAAALLAGPSNGTSIERVAERSGFGSPSSFSRAFRARFGSSPRDWRRQQQEERGRPAS
ncbi:MAG: helix-turn-helix domain-containing protein, partial [Promicromonosporaceae bacterium]|nr:helix-turn-helix domain-containing protein [Promicromonosporaceae bacterium]